MNTIVKSAKPLHDLLQSIISLPNEEWNWLQSSLITRKFNPGEILFKPGDLDAGIHYLQNGLVRYFYLTKDGRELNHSFAAEGNLVACFPTFVGNEPCTFFIEALEETNTLVIPSSTVQVFSYRNKCWNLLTHRLFAHIALRKATREAEFLQYSAEARYRRFLSQYAELAHRLPQYHIASYLGITPVALSRIRKRINLG